LSKHKHNYTQYSEKKQHNQNTNPVEKPAIAEEVLKPISKTPEVKMDSAPVLVNETVETKPIPKTVEGMVVGCAKLNVRAEASLFSDVICTLNAQSEIEIDIEKSDRDWFYICTATGIEGYCMRKYVEAHL
jgi:hypothetical protein